MKIEIEVSDKNEATSAPYWVIINPMKNLNTDVQGVHNIAGMITGLFFSREEAEDFLQRTRYNFTKGARVYCLSGHNGVQYNSKFNL